VSSIRHRLGYSSGWQGLQGAGPALEHCLECALSREASKWLEAVSRPGPDGPHHRPWHQQLDRTAAPWTRTRCAESIYSADARSDREGYRRAIAWMEQP